MVIWLFCEWVFGITHLPWFECDYRFPLPFPSTASQDFKLWPNYSYSTLVRIRVSTLWQIRNTNRINRLNYSKPISQRYWHFLYWRPIRVYWVNTTITTAKTMFSTDIGSDRQTVQTTQTCLGNVSLVLSINLFWLDIRNPMSMRCAVNRIQSMSSITIHPKGNRKHYKHFLRICFCIPSTDSIGIHMTRASVENWWLHSLIRVKPIKRQTNRNKLLPKRKFSSKNEFLIPSIQSLINYLMH